MAIYERICRECGVTFQGGPRAWYCPECRKRRERERARKRSKDPARKLGSTDLCENCGAEYIVQSGLQKYCKKCKPIMHKALDRRQSLDYYNTHKDDINPRRNAARRVPWRRCVVCGGLFQPRGTRKTCGGECRKIYYRDLQRVIYEKRRIWKMKHTNEDEKSHV